MKIIFGSLVTSGYGKIGGQFVKRIKGGHSLNNLMKTKSKTALINNNQLANLSYIFAQWSKISDNQRTEWNNIAALVPVPAPDGSNKYLSGREFFIKVNSQNLPISTSIIDSSQFNTTVGDATVSPDSIDVAAQEFNVDFLFSNSITYFVVRIDALRNKSRTAFYKNSKALVWYNIDESVPINMWNVLIAKFPNVKVGDYFSVSFSPCNDVGWQRGPLVYKVQAV